MIRDQREIATEIQRWRDKGIEGDKKRQNGTRQRGMNRDLDRQIKKERQTD